MQVPLVVALKKGHSEIKMKVQLEATDLLSG
jgi:hypothetical protein